MSNARTRTLKTLMKGREKFKRGLLSDKERLDPHGRKWSLVRGDKVQVVHRRHAEFGKSGTILQIDRRRDRVKVEGVNMKPFIVKGNKALNIKGWTEERERMIPYGSVNLVDPVTGLPTRVYKKFLEDGSKVRVSKKSGAIIPRPEILSIRKRPLRVTEGDCDTTGDEVWKETYSPDERSTWSR
mmetsp:Transcript_16701/g.33248  ORF Transcript_16701/g.33248 Transcript_16701/m.33248 type:complete len:184 (-) Transcript_16701:284-835(-)